MKPQNIGFTSSGQLKLFDFGLSACVRRRSHLDQAYEMTGCTGTLAYMAPEAVLYRPYNEKVDVYSYSIVLWQMLTGELPFDGMDRAQFIERVAKGGERPNLLSLFSGVPVAVMHLMDQCWHENHSLRPGFVSIYRTIDVFCSSRHPPLTKLKPAPEGRRIRSAPALLLRLPRNLASVNKVSVALTDHHPHKENLFYVDATLEVAGSPTTRTYRKE